MIIVTGPTGNTGQIVVEGLKSRNIPFRAMVRSDANARALAARGVPTVYGDFEKPESLRAALSGATAAYLVCTPDERLARCERNFIEAAKTAGVQRIVECGAHLAAHDSPSPNLRMHAEVEDALKRSGLTYTIVRPHGFMQTFFGFSAPLIMEKGIMSYPAGDGPIPLIDVRDVGAALVKALTEPGFENRCFDLTGPEALTPTQMAAAMSKAFGRSITYVDCPEEALEGALRQLGVPDAPRQHVLWAFREQRAHRFTLVSEDHRAFGIKLHTYAEFAADIAAGRA
jgi:uncharacterized protein YbjT (DUF2867 family)